MLWGRALTLSVVALSVGSAAHAEAGGLLPGPLALAVLAVLGTLAALPLLRRPASTLRLVVLTVLGQTAVHTALAVVAGHRGDPVAGPAHAPVAPAVPQVPVGSGAARGSYFEVAYDAAPASLAGDGSGGPVVPAPLLHALTDVVDQPVMALAHLLAAAACGWWLARGERALWALVTLVAQVADQVAVQPWTRAVARCVAAATLTARAASHGARARGPRPPLLLLEPPPRGSQTHRRCVSRRGPPLAA
ncbi:hypothetical protein SAMN04488570_2034 [Nocardioides scoriae]|uniref:Integral membrane protein n=2 Tax=Nocardioides scoriae TaxID=642780 RepID=A0A1H1SSG6_9ACTN|nr:hypothetical protein SAMN04488570_2034 [Nocardioides scoriae]